MSSTKNQKKLQLCNQKDLTPKLVPSNRIYYELFPYKIVIVGDRVNYDPVTHYAFNTFLKDNKIKYRSHWTYSHRCIYLDDYTNVKLVCQFFSGMIKEVHGPITKKHLDEMTIKHDSCVKLRKQLYYNKYDARLELFIKSDQYLQAREDVKDLIDTYLPNNRWGDSGSSWFYNYVYCDASELKASLPFIKIGISDRVTRLQSTYVKLLSEMINT